MINLNLKKFQFRMMLPCQAFSKFIIQSISSPGFHQVFVFLFFGFGLCFLLPMHPHSLLLSFQATAVSREYSDFPTYPPFAHADFSSLETFDTRSTRGFCFKLQTKGFRFFSIPQLALISFFFVLRIS